MDLTDEKLLDDLVSLLSTTRPQEVYSKELKDSIERGLNDYKEGRVRPHNVVMEELKAKYGL